MGAFLFWRKGATLFWNEGSILSGTRGQRTLDFPHDLIGERTNKLVVFQNQLVFLLCIIHRRCLFCHNL